MSPLFPTIFIFLLFHTMEINCQGCNITTPCATPHCCSQWGNCGHGPDFCGDGCQHGCDSAPTCGLYAHEENFPVSVCCSQFGNCGTTSDFCGTGCQNNCGDAPTSTCQISRDMIRVGYYSSWASARACGKYSVDEIPVGNYTHLNYAFGNIQNGVMINPSEGTEEWDNLAAFSALKATNPAIRLLISVGGYAFNDPGPTQREFHNLAINTTTRARFIQSVSTFSEEWNLDGCDADWEYPVDPDRGGSPEDRENYVALLKEMRAAFGQKWLITIAAPASYWYLRHFKVDEMQAQLDWINVMSYDYNGAWDPERLARPHSGIREMEESLQLFRKGGVPPEKLVFGLGFYGRSYTLTQPECGKGSGCEFNGPGEAGACTAGAGTLAYFEIEELIKAQNLAPGLDSLSLTRYLNYDGGKQWVTYDDEITLKFKTDWARVNCLKGVMVWSVDQGVEKKVEEEDNTGGSETTVSGVSLVVVTFLGVLHVQGRFM
ncbi:endochitinase [Folsomia candida]|nr:endochitinase [Folsomia candida]